MEGMWSEHFPDAAVEKLAAALPRRERCFICPNCNARTCRLLTSNTDKNPGRQFYKCPNATTPYCKEFFKWADKVEPHELIEVPYCGGCTAGVCRVEKVIHGPNKGRIMFTCRIKEGEGSCGYKVWKDELEILEARQAEERKKLFESGMENCNKTASTDADLVKGLGFRVEGIDPVSPLCESSDDLLCPDVTSQTMDHKAISCKMDKLKCLQGKSNITSRRPHKRSRYGDIIVSDFPISASFQTVAMGLNSVSTRDCWKTDAVRRNLSIELNGWWGRLVFRPTSCLMAYALRRSPTSSISYPLESTFMVQNIEVNSSGSITAARNSTRVESCRKLSFNLDQYRNPLDSTYAVQDKILVNYSDATTTLARSPLLGAESYCKTLPSQGQHHNTELSVTLSNVSLNEPSYRSRTPCIMSNAFHQAAECLKNEFLAHLETMDVKDHEAMSQEAEATFAALDSLHFDHEDLKKRAKELIHCASSLVEIEQSMPENDSYQMLVELCSAERVRLDEMKCVHDKAVGAVINHKKRLNVLQEEISSTMDWLFEIEAQVSCCEIEMKNLELQLEKISKNKEVLEGKYLIAYEELEESQKLLEQKESERNAAKVAFNRARALLRG